MRCFSLFSGIGGFDLALQNQGHEIVGACEIDRYARQVYSKHFPNVKIWEDATKIRSGELPEFDLLCAGFPCQTFSIAGRRLGFEESRGTLFFEIGRIAREKRPRYLLLENVKGLLSHDNGKTFAEILATLDELGYDAEWQVFNSKHWVPQNRERIFIIGYLREGSTKQIFPLGEITGVSKKERQAEQGKETWLRSHVSTIDSRYGAVRNCGETYIMIPYALRNNNANGRRIKNPEEPVFTIDSSGSSGLIVLHNDKHSTNRLYDPQGTARSLRAESGGKGSKTGLYKTTQGVRRLTPLECERLQGFPDGWTEGVSDTQRYRQLGNAVTVPVVEFIIHSIREVTKE